MKVYCDRIIFVVLLIVSDRGKSFSGGDKHKDMMTWSRNPITRNISHEFVKLNLAPYPHPESVHISKNFIAQCQLYAGYLACRLSTIHVHCATHCQETPIWVSAMHALRSKIAYSVNSLF